MEGFFKIGCKGINEFSLKKTILIFFTKKNGDITVEWCTNRNIIWKIF